MAGLVDGDGDSAGGEDADRRSSGSGMTPDVLADVGSGETSGEAGDFMTDEEGLAAIASLSEHLVAMGLPPMERPPAAYFSSDSDVTTVVANLLRAQDKRFGPIWGMIDTWDNSRSKSLSLDALARMSEREGRAAEAVERSAVVVRVYQQKFVDAYAVHRELVSRHDALARFSNRRLSDVPDYMVAIARYLEMLGLTRNDVRSRNGRLMSSIREAIEGVLSGTLDTTQSDRSDAFLEAEFESIGARDATTAGLQLDALEMISGEGMALRRRRLMRAYRENDVSVWLEMVIELLGYERVDRDLAGAGFRMPEAFRRPRLGDVSTDSGKPASSTKTVLTGDADISSAAPIASGDGVSASSQTISDADNVTIEPALSPSIAASTPSNPSPASSDSSVDRPAHSTPLAGSPTTSAPVDAPVDAPGAVAGSPSIGTPVSAPAGGAGGSSVPSIDGGAGASGSPGGVPNAPVLTGSEVTDRVADATTSPAVSAPAAPPVATPAPTVAPSSESSATPVSPPSGSPAPSSDSMRPRSAEHRPDLVEPLPDGGRLVKTIPGYPPVPPRIFSPGPSRSTDSAGGAIPASRPAKPAGAPDS